MLLHDAPEPLDIVEIYNPKQWPLTVLSPLPRPDPHHECQRSFGDVIESRRTQRDFAALSEQQLSQVLWWTVRQQAASKSEMGFPQQLKPVMSGGACHPIHLLICRPPHNELSRYCPVKHATQRLEVDHQSMQALLESISAAVPIGIATIFLFAAEYGKTAARYSNWESLLWRDAGALLGHLALVAEANYLNFCALGLTGEPFTSTLDSQGRLAGVGACLIGSRS